MQFSATYSHCPGESINISDKRLLHCKALQFNFEKCNFGNQLFSDIYSIASGAVEVFLGKIGAATAVAVSRFLYSKLYRDLGVTPTYILLYICK